MGAFLKLEGGNIMLHGPGKVEFKASMKELAGPGSASAVLPDMPRASALPPNSLEVAQLYHDSAPVQGAQYEAHFADGSIRKGATNSGGKVILKDVPAGAVRIRYQPDARAYTAKPIEKSAQHKASMSETDWDALAATHRQNKGGDV
jgi:type VI secretion system secreted protein VgrG